MSAWTDWIKPALQIGGGFFGAWNEQQNQQRASQQMLDAYQHAAQQNYQNQLAYMNWQTGEAEKQRQAAASARASNRAAAMQNAANQQKALKRQMGVEQGFFDQASSYLQPYAQLGSQLLPQVGQTYGQGLTGTNLLAAYYNSPQAVAQMQQSVPAYSINIPRPKEYL